MSIYDTATKSAGGSTSIYDRLPVVPAPIKPPSNLLSTTSKAPIDFSKLTLSPDTSIVSNIKATAAGAVKGFQDVPVAPKTFDLVAGVGSQNALTAAHDAFSQGVDQISNHLVTVADSGKPTLERAVALGSAAVETINTGFGVLLSPFASYATVPGLGNIYDGVNKIFGAIGGGGGAALSTFVNQLPIDQKTKDIVSPLAQETGALIAQLGAGKAMDAGGQGIKNTISRITDNSKAIVTELSNDPAIQEAIANHTREPVKVPVTSNVETTPVKISTPATKQADYAKSQGYEPYTPPDQLPTIQMGAKPKPTEPVIRAEAPAARRVAGDLTIEPIKPPVAAIAPRTALGEAPVVKTTETQPVASKAATEPLPKPLTTEPGVSRIGKSIEAKAVEAKLTQGFKDTAGYDPITIKDQAEKASGLINDNLETARAVIRGDQPLPDGLRGTALITAMEEHIKANPSGELAHELANSPLVSATSHAAQELRLAAERVPDSLTAQFRAIKAARETALEKRGGYQKASKAITDQIKKEIKSNASKRPTWEEFIKEVQCSY